MKEILFRSSVRSYQDKPVEPDKIEAILKAAMQAPSATNQQPWEFIVVQDKATLEKLSNASLYTKPLLKAPLAIVVLGNKNKLNVADYLPQDLAACTENILIELIHLELGGVWLGIAPREDRIEKVVKVFNLPDHILPFAIVAIGYPLTNKPVLSRYNKTAVHYEKYQSEL